MNQETALKDSPKYLTLTVMIGLARVGESEKGSFASAPTGSVQALAKQLRFLSAPHLLIELIGLYDKLQIKITAPSSSLV
jgi:hypothetical protein